MQENLLITLLTKHIKLAYASNPSLFGYANNHGWFQNLQKVYLLKDY